MRQVYRDKLGVALAIILHASKVSLKELGLMIAGLEAQDREQMKCHFDNGCLGLGYRAYESHTRFIRG